MKIKEFLTQKGASLCQQCDKKHCCNYVAFQIDTPKDEEDYDDLLWQVSHAQISFFIDDEGDWYINIPSRCQHLKANGDCAIYHTRPMVCREHSNYDCEYHGYEYNFEAEFTDYQSLLNYVLKKFPQFLNRYQKVKQVMEYRSYPEDKLISIEKGN